MVKTFVCLSFFLLLSKTKTKQTKLEDPAFIFFGDIHAVTGFEYELQNKLCGSYVFWLPLILLC